MNQQLPYNKSVYAFIAGLVVSYIILALIGLIVIFTPTVGFLLGGVLLGTGLSSGGIFATLFSFYFNRQFIDSITDKEILYVILGYTLIGFFCSFIVFTISSSNPQDLGSLLPLPILIFTAHLLITLVGTISTYQYLRHRKPVFNS